jgi:flagellar assembly protein FliH
MQAQAMQKFLFDRDFDDLEILREIVEQEVQEQELAQEHAKVEAEAPVAPPAPMFSEEELAAARIQAFEAGKREGRSESLASIEQQVAATLDRLATDIATLFATQTANNDAMARDTASLALAVAKKLFPRLYATHGLSEIVGVTEEILANLIREPRLVVSVHEMHADVLRTRLNEFLARRGFAGVLDLRGESGLGAGDCKIEWMGGDAARDTAALFAEIENVIERHVGKMAMDEASDRMSDQMSGRPMQG